MADLGALRYEVDLDTDKFDSGIGQVRSKADGVASHLQGAFSKAQMALGPLAVGFGAIGAGIGAVVATGLGFNNQMEQSRAKLMAFNKDADKTTEQLAWIEAEASKTPFAFADMAEAMAALNPIAASSGEQVEDLIRQAEILAASNPAEGLTGASFALKEAMSGDFASIIERFNLSRSYINELKEQGMSNAEIVNAAMTQAGMDADLVTALANTAQGRLSTLQDTFTSLAGKITQPIFDTFSTGLGNLNGYLEASAPVLEAFAVMLADKVAGALTWIGDVAIPGLINAWTQIQPVVMPLIDILAANLMPILAGVAATITALVVPAIATAVVAFLSVAAPVAAMIAIGALLFSAWQSNFGGIRDIVTSVITTVSNIIITVMSAVQAFWITNGSTILENATTTWNTIMALITTLVTLIQTNVMTQLANIQNLWNTHKTEIIGVATGLWTMVQGLFQVGSSLVMGVIKILTAALRGDWQGAKEAIGTMVEGMWNGIKTAFSGGATVVQNVVRIGLDQAKGHFETLKTNVTTTVSGIWTTVTTKFNEIISFIQGLGGRFSSAGSALINNMASGFMSAINGLISDAKRKLAELTALLPGSEPKNPNSPLRGLGRRGTAFVTNFGTPLLAGLDKLNMQVNTRLGNLAPVGLNAVGNTVNNNRSVNVNLQSMQSSGSLMQDVMALQTLLG